MSHQQKMYLEKLSARKRKISTSRSSVGKWLEQGMLSLFLTASKTFLYEGLQPLNSKENSLVSDSLKSRNNRTSFHKDENFSCNRVNGSLKAYNSSEAQSNNVSKERRRKGYLRVERASAARNKNLDSRDWIKPSRTWISSPIINLSPPPPLLGIDFNKGLK